MKNELASANKNLNILLKKNFSFFQKRTNKKIRNFVFYKNKDLEKEHKIFFKQLKNKLKKSNKKNIFSENSFAYQKNKNIFKAVKIHIKNKSHFFLKVDIQNFFESIPHKLIILFFKNNKKVKKEDLLMLKKIIEIQKQINIYFKRNKNFGFSQGLFFSPFFSEILMINFDDNLKKTIQKYDKKIVYSRYADDILLSSKEDTNFKKIYKNIIENLKDIRLSINNKKTKYIHLQKGNHIKYLGVNIIRSTKSGKIYPSLKRSILYNIKNTKDEKLKKGLISFRDDFFKNFKNYIKNEDFK